MDAGLLREHNVAMQRKHDESMVEMRRANSEKDALNNEHRKREMEIFRENEAKKTRDRKEAEQKMDLLSSTYNKNIEEKSQEILKTKDTMHAESITLMHKNEKERGELQKEHLQNFNEQQRKFIEQQKLTQEKFENETTALRSDAVRREQLLKEEKIAAEREFQRQMKEQETMTKEERLETQKRHEDYIKSKDAAIDNLREETEKRVEDLHEANRVQQANDLATLQKIVNERIEREKEVHAHNMERERNNQEDRAILYEQMLKDKEKNHAMLFLAMKQRQDDAHQYQQILAAIPRAVASEQETTKLASFKSKLHEIASNTDKSITNFDLLYGNYKKKSNTQTFASLEKAATDLNECVKVLQRTVTETITQIGACTSVAAATRNQWILLVRHLQSLTMPFTRSASKLLGITKRKAITTEAIDSLMKEFDTIRDKIYDLPNLSEGSVMGMLEQRQSEIVHTQQNRLNMLTLTGKSSLPSIQAVEDKK